MINALNDSLAYSPTNPKQYIATINTWMILPVFVFFRHVDTGEKIVMMIIIVVSWGGQVWKDRFIGKQVVTLIMGKLKPTTNVVVALRRHDVIICHHVHHDGVFRQHVVDVRGRPSKHIHWVGCALCFTVVAKSCRRSKRSNVTFLKSWNDVDVLRPTPKERAGEDGPTLITQATIV
eukprot:Lithocolla_globosa_v1_NODE_242_length_4902_cov_29.482773.p4 type:complete len:177 gc:universal NODE_242_length_4902_cov_29.482773:3822-4352(+)